MDYARFYVLFAVVLCFFEDWCLSTKQDEWGDLWLLTSMFLFTE